MPEPPGRKPWVGASPPEFRLEGERCDSTFVLTVTGDVDLHSADELAERLELAIIDGAASLVVDLSAATFLDSQGLGALVRSARRLDSPEGRFRVVVPAAQIRRVFEIASLDRVFPLDWSREEALARLAPLGPPGP